LLPILGCLCEAWACAEVCRAQVQNMRPEVAAAWERKWRRDVMGVSFYIVRTQRISTPVNIA
jgi:hypothetical protein